MWQNEFQNVGLHHFGRECAMASEFWQQEYHTAHVWKSASFCQVVNACESVRENLFGLNCISNTNYSKNVTEIQNTFLKISKIHITNDVF